MATLPDSRFFIAQTESASDMERVREVFVEYEESLGFSLCFQNFDRELAELPGDYAPPGGRLLVARYGADLAACVALHGVDPSTCEMKRLYVRPQFRGAGIGRGLIMAVISDARKIGYQKMRLDTVEPKMKSAVALYRALGFREIAPYRLNPIEGAMYMELEL